MLNFISKNDEILVKFKVNHKGTRLFLRGSGVCSECTSDVLCVTIHVIHRPVERMTGGDTANNTSGSATTDISGDSAATYYTNVAAMWNNPEVSTRHIGPHPFE